MMRSRWTYVVFLIIILTIKVPISEAQTEPSINLQGLTWNHSIITVLVVPQSHQPWWDTSYLNASLRAINLWNNAILNFSSYSSQFYYLSQIRMISSVSQALEPGFDIYITWQEEYEGTNTLGTSQAVYELPCTIINNTISLWAKTKGYVLNEVDMQNVAIHELGHALGLGHSDYSGDIMYPEYTPRGDVRALSTLDLYGVSIVFEWLSHYPEPPNKCPSELSVILPQDIQYEYLPISYADLPPQSPHSYKTLLDFVLGLINSPHGIVLLLLLSVTLIVLLVAIWRVKSTKIAPKDDALVLNEKIDSRSTIGNSGQEYFD
ncbi:MAG: matrixin family metalloprotease [Nitrososphaerales archaeon]